ncbi:hypothetical protein [Sphingomicrobium lutaoense]|uniref:Uncharacterized protein n=1 Tax=Sphingomicrobium lutaoense TaxID=515949 RepID=A0A839Z564_9SPHN|nr:hypothetical protein [Sphingomicrobium lutaoense]MBB3765023.1 hypothetical protein [Sphingomicrobium lutaoense]
MRFLIAALAATTAFATPALAQSGQQEQQRQQAMGQMGQMSPAARAAMQSGNQPDVLLDIPNLSIDELTVEVDSLEVDISLDARLANLLKLTAGANASVDKVKIGIKGVQAQATLIVRFDNVKEIIDRTLQTIDNNPEIVEGLFSTVDNTVGTVGNVANNAVSTVGNLTTTLLREGQLLNLANSGLSLVNETVNAAGNTVRQVRSSNGGLYEVVTDASNRILSSRQLSSR